MQIRESPSGRFLRGSSTGEIIAWDEATEQWLPATFDELLPGAPIYDVMKAPFNAVGDGVADDTAAINAAIAAANNAPGPIFLGYRHLITGALTTIANNNISLIGRGQFNGGTIVLINANPLPSALLTITGQYALVEGIWFGVIGTLDTTSWCIRLNAFRPTLRNLLITTFGNGIEIDRCNTAFLENCQVGDVLGSYAYYAHGLGGQFNHNTQYTQCLAGQSYPLSLGLGRGNWAPATAYLLGQVVRANGALWQCSTAGTSAGAGTGPSGLPSTLASSVHVTPVVDGTAQWRFAMGAFAGFSHGSFCHTVMYEKCGVLQGDFAMHIFDDGGNAPTFSHAWQFSADHCFGGGIDLEACDGAVWFDQTLVTSILAGNGIEIGSAAVGWSFLSGQVFGCQQNGITIAGTGGGIIQAMTIAGIGSPANTFDGIAVAASAQNFQIYDNVIGDVSGTASPARYGISIGAGCDNFQVEGNRLLGNDTGPLLNNTEKTDTCIVRNNVPEAAYYDATDGVMKVSLAGGVQTLTITDPNVHTVIITPSGAVVISAIIHPSALSTQNSGVRLKIIKEGTSNSVALRDGNASTNAIWTPDSVDYELTRFNDAVEVQQLQTALLTSIRWRVLARALPRSATIVIAVPNVAATTSAYVDTTLVGTVLQDAFAVGEAVLVNPQQDVIGAGLGQFGLLSARISAANTLRCMFVGTAPGGNQNFTVSSFRP